MLFQIVNRFHPKRDLVEAQIRGVYHREYGARLADFPNTLVALFDEDGFPVCAAGLRVEVDGFFSERYLDDALEATLSRIWKRPVYRENIAEISNLAGCRSGASLVLMQHITHWLREQGITWAVFTATTRLRAMLRRTGVPALDVCAADSARVPDPTQWGTYYETAPRVCAIHDDMVLVRTPDQRHEPLAAFA